MSALERALIATIAWFDMSDYPLTAWEAWKWRMHLQAGDGDQTAFPGDAYLDVMQSLEHLVRQGRLERKWSFFFLPGREPIVEIRRKRYLLVREKFKRARWVVRILRCIPWVRMISVCNTLGYSNASQGSDIDLFIVTAPGRAWTVRALGLAFLRLLRLRPLLMRFGAKRDEKQDRIDLTFFVDETALDLSGLALRDEAQSLKLKAESFFELRPLASLPPLASLACGGEPRRSGSAFDSIPDPYLSYWIVQQTPLWDRGGYYQKFWDANAALRAPLAHAIPYLTGSLRRIRGTSMWQYVLRALLAWVPEKRWRSIELAVMPARLKEGAGGIGVVLGDHILKFHDIDPRSKLRERWRDKLDALSSQSFDSAIAPLRK